MKQYINDPEIERLLFFNEMEHRIYKPYYPFYPALEVTTLNAIVPDFQVNDNSGPKGAYQSKPKIAFASNGNYMFVWTDYRNGDSDIFAQLYSATGSPIGNNFRVNNDEDCASQVAISVTTDGDENFVVLWEDDRRDAPGVYAQRYSIDGAVSGNNFKIKRDEADYFDIQGSVKNDGGIILSWDVNAGEDWEVFAQLFSQDDTPLGSSFKVNDDESGTTQYRPYIATEANGNFIIVWFDGRDGDRAIYAQRFSSIGLPIGVNFKTNDEYGGDRITKPAVAMDNSGNFVVTWYDIPGDVYARLFSRDGLPMGHSFKANEAEKDGFACCTLSAAFDAYGNFVVAWSDLQKVFAQYYDSGGNALDGNITVYDDAGDNYKFRQDVAMNDSGQFIITWEDGRNDEADVYAQLYTRDRAKPGNNFKVNDDAGSGWQGFPCLTTDKRGNFSIAWVDQSVNTEGDIYAVRYLSEGSRVSNLIKVNG